MFMFVLKTLTSTETQQTKPSKSYEPRLKTGSNSFPIYHSSILLSFSFSFFASTFYYLSLRILIPFSVFLYKKICLSCALICVLMKYLEVLSSNSCCINIRVTYIRGAPNVSVIRIIYVGHNCGFLEYFESGCLSFCHLIVFWSIYSVNFKYVKHNLSKWIDGMCLNIWSSDGISCMFQVCVIWRIQLITCIRFWKKKKKELVLYFGLPCRQYWSRQGRPNPNKTWNWKSSIYFSHHDILTHKSFWPIVCTDCPKAKYVCCRFGVVWKNFFNLNENYWVMLNLKRTSTLKLVLKVLSSMSFFVCDHLLAL